MNSNNTHQFLPLQAKYIAEAEEKYNNLLKMLDPQLSLNYQRRCVEATKEGKFATLKFYSMWNWILFSFAPGSADVYGIWNF